MVTKIKMLQNLQKVKLVLGNGFDLFCGLHTTYKDFFTHDPTYKTIKQWIVKNTALAKEEIEVFQFYARESSIDLEPLGDACVWDLFFVMTFGIDGNFDWCDIEKGILCGLQKADPTSATSRAGNPHWENVRLLLDQTDGVDSVNLYSWLLAAFINKKNPKLSGKDTTTFYEYLLRELKAFEQRFGEYILCQHVRYDQYMPHFNEAYVEYSFKLINAISSSRNVASIDCFNYCFPPFEYDRLFERCHFVNGSFANPIFGVDTVFAPDDPRFVFTKTNRRIELDMELDYSFEDREYQNVIVFGHSLSSHDFSYFFPILDQLEMTNAASKKRFVFAYCVPNGKNRSDVKKEKRKALYSLFTDYAVLKGMNDLEKGRFLDSLTTQGRILTVEIEPITALDDSFRERFFNIKSKTGSREENLNLLWGYYESYCHNLNYVALMPEMPSFVNDD